MEQTLIDATKSELPIIHQLAHAIWPTAFREILTPQQINYMLEWMYSLPALEQQMQAGYHFILYKDKIHKGYCSYKHEEGYTLLSKIYILPEIQGKGAGKALLKEVIQRTLNKGQKTIQLNVNRYNTAVSFYKKMGFKITRQEDNDIGNGYFMNDYVMELKL